MEFAHNIFSNERLRHWSFFSFAAQDPGEKIAAQKPAPVRAASRTRPLRILLVEDHRDTLRSLKLLLTRLGHRVLCAENMTEALRISEAQQFDLLLSDIGLPDGSGIELMEKLKSNHPIFGIALTGFGMEEDLRKSHDVGFNHHLVKPVDLNRLDALIQQADPVTAAAGAPTR